MPVRPPADIHLHCTLCVDPEFDSTGWTEAWNHQLDVHPGVTVEWTLLGTIAP